MFVSFYKQTLCNFEYLAQTAVILNFQYMLFCFMFHMLALQKVSYFIHDTSTGTILTQVTLLTQHNLELLLSTFFFFINKC